MDRLGIDSRHQRMQVMRANTHVPIAAGAYSEIIVPADGKKNWAVVLISAVEDAYVNWGVDATANDTASMFG